MSTTTVQVRTETLELLKLFQKAAQTRTYDETINYAISKSAGKTESLYGFLGKKTMKQILKGLRDESDRI